MLKRGPCLSADSPRLSDLRWISLLDTAMLDSPAQQPCLRPQLPAACTAEPHTVHVMLRMQVWQAARWWWAAADLVLSRLVSAAAAAAAQDEAFL